MEDFYFRKTKSYRLWVDDQGIGYIRILKRVNFKIIASIFEEIHDEIKKDKSDIKIVFYISKALYDELSNNTKEFLEFCQSCIGVEFDLVLLEIKK